MLVTENFRDMATFVARAEGLPSVPVVVTPHPIAGTSLEYMAEVAASLAPEVAERLCGR